MPVIALRVALRAEPDRTSNVHHPGAESVTPMNDYSIWIGTEEWVSGEWTSADDTTDVIVTFNDGIRWGATFFSYTNITSLVEKNRKTGEWLDGKYFWASQMILVDEISRTRIEEVVNHLIKKGDFESIFEIID